jgi:hypothetical protein
MSSFLKALLLAGIVLALMGGPNSVSAGDEVFTGTRVCEKCHDHHATSWRKTPHAKAFRSLQPGKKVKAKSKAKLDPNRDYSADPDCIGCHTTGFGLSGGYDPDKPAKELAKIGCESCHGAGSLYREAHGEGERVMLADAEPTQRSVLVAAGQNFDFGEACARCHMNYEGSPWKGAKAPYSPFTPKLDAKYTFDFEKAVRSDAIHTHYKLYDIFVGPPVPPFRDEIQSTAEETE